MTTPLLLPRQILIQVLFPLLLMFNYSESASFLSFCVQFYSYCFKILTLFYAVLFFFLFLFSVNNETNIKKLFPYFKFIAMFLQPFSHASQFFKLYKSLLFFRRGYWWWRWKWCYWYNEKGKLSSFMFFFYNSVRTLCSLWNHCPMIVIEVSFF